MSRSTAVENAPRKRGRPPSDAGPKKRKHPTIGLEQSSVGHINATAGLQRPTSDFVLIHSQDDGRISNSDPRARGGGFIQAPLAMDGGVYANVLPDGSLAYAVGPEVAPMNPALFQERGLFPYDYVQMYSYSGEVADKGASGFVSAEGVLQADLSPDPTPSRNGQAVPPSFFLQSPMLTQDPAPQAASMSYMEYAPNPYLNYEVNSSTAQLAMMPLMGGEQTHSIGMHVAPSFLNVTAGMFAPQLASQNEMMAPDVTQQAAMGPASRQLGRAGTSRGKRGATGTVKPRTAPARPVSSRHRVATMMTVGSPSSQAATPIHPVSSPQSGGRQNLGAATPHLPTTILSTPKAIEPLPTLSPSPLYAPTPRTCAETPNLSASTPPPPSSTPFYPQTASPTPPTAPTPFASTSSSDLSSVPPESPTATKNELADDSSCNTSSDELSHPPCVPVEVHSTTKAQLTAALEHIKTLESHLLRLAPANRPPDEDLVLSITKRIGEAEHRASTHQANEQLLKVSLDDLKKGKLTAETRAKHLEQELRRKNHHVSGSNDLAIQCARLESVIASQKYDMGKVNLLVQQVTEKLGLLEHAKAYHLSQLAKQAGEIAVLREELAEAHGKVAQLVSIRGVALEEVSPIHLSPPLERSSSSIPPTPLDTPYHPLPFDTQFTPRSYHGPQAGINCTPTDTGAVEPDSPWNNWVQLDSVSGRL